MSLEKFIYGLAIPTPKNDYPCWKYDPDTKTYTFERINSAGILTDGLVGMLEDHSLDKQLGRTDDGTLDLYFNDQGLFFRLRAANPAALSAYKRVKRGALRHCSIAGHFKHEDRVRLLKEEEKAKQIVRTIGCDKVIFQELCEIHLYEISLTNNPLQDFTFCTTDQHDKRLPAIDWNNPTKLNGTSDNPLPLLRKER